MKNVLMILPFFPPNAGGGVYRALSFVKYLEKFGWRATVITPQPESYWIVDEALLADVPPSCEVHHTRTLSGQFVLKLLRGEDPRGSHIRSSRGFGILRKLGALALIPDTYVGWRPFALRVAKQLVARRQFDVIFSTSPPETSHFIGYHLHRSTGIPWLADFRDPWTNLYVLRPSTPFHARIHKALEEKICRNASHVVVTNRAHRDRLVGNFPGIKPPGVVSNGYDHDKFGRYANLEPAANRCRILHAGTLTESRSAVPFLRGLRIFLEREPGAAERLEVLFVGPREDENDAAVRRLGLEGVVEFRDTVPHDSSLQLMHTSHILLLIALQHQMPGKFFEYIGARRPILALVPDGEVKDIVVQLRRGEVSPMDNSQSIAVRVGEMYEKCVGGVLDRDYDLSVVVEYQREALTATLAQYLDQLTTRGSTS